MSIANDTGRGDGVLAHHRAAALMWGQGGGAYDDISFGLSDALAHAAQRLSPRPDEEILDVHRHRLDGAQCRPRRRPRDRRRYLLGAAGGSAEPVGSCQPAHRVSDSRCGTAAVSRWELRRRDLDLRRHVCPEPEAGGSGARPRLPPRSRRSFNRRQGGASFFLRLGGWRFRPGRSMGRSRISLRSSPSTAMRPRHRRHHCCGEIRRMSASSSVETSSSSSSVASTTPTTPTWTISGSGMRAGSGRCGN
jgi:hypothetical protein